LKIRKMTQALCTDTATFDGFLPSFCDKIKGSVRNNSYVSPLNWEHINLYGHYSFDKKNITTLDSLRPLNIKDDEQEC